MVGLLCQTAKKDSRHELLRRVAAGGGVFQSESGLKIHLPAANLNDVANQADDLLEVLLWFLHFDPCAMDNLFFYSLVGIDSENSWSPNFFL